MNKRQTVWLITRLIGVYFAYWAIVSLLSLVGAIYAYTSLPSAPATPANKQPTLVVNGQQIPTNPTRANQATTTPGVETPAEKAKSDALKEVLWQFFLTVLYGGIGFYLIRNGKILFSTLNREELADNADETESVLPTKPKEKVVTTLDLSPSGKKEEVTSLNLSEYVPKTVVSAPPVEEKTEETRQPEILPEPQEPEVLAPNIEPQMADLTPEISPIANEQTWKNLEIAPTKEETAQVETTAEQSAPVEHVEMPKISDDELLTIEQTAPEINEQPTEQPAPSDVSADMPSDEKK